MAGLNPRFSATLSPVSMDIEAVLERSLRHLLKEPQRTGNWGDVRGTADSLIAIHEALPDGRFPELRRYASEWLLARMEADGEDTASWEEEVWDTAIATLALSPVPAARGAVQQAVGWLAARFQRPHGNWNDEPWETLWALLAVESAHVRAHVRLPEIDFAKAVAWLISLRGTPRAGVLVNWHYTALFCLVARRYAAPAMEQVLGRDLQLQLTEAAAESARTIAQEMGCFEDGDLWTTELWSNSLVLWALAESQHAHAHLPGLGQVVAWFDSMLATGTDVFTEDRAFACVALSRLSGGLERAQELAFTRDLSAHLSAAPPELTGLIERCGAIVGAQKRTDLRERLSRRLADFRDYVPRAPLISRDVFHGYYTLNLRDLPANVFLIVGATAALTLAARNADAYFGEEAGSVAMWVPLALGSLATLAQLMNFSLPKLFSRQKALPTTDD